MSQLTQVLRIPANSFVTYYPRRSLLGAQPAVLEWTETQQIRLIIIGRASQLPIRVVFDSPVSDIGSLATRTGGFALTIGPATERIGFGSWWGATLLQLGFFGGSHYGPLQSRRTRIAWLNALRVAGVAELPREIAARPQRHGVAEVEKHTIARYNAHGLLPTAPPATARQASDLNK